MAAGNFVSEMQRTLLAQQKRDDRGPRTLPNNRMLEMEVPKTWNALVAWIEARLAEINRGLTEPLLLYSKPLEEEFYITNKAAEMSVTVRRESNGNLVYKGTSASGKFRVQIAGNDLAYSWERTTSTPSLRVTFSSVGVNVTVDEMGELIIRSVVTP